MNDDYSDLGDPQPSFVRPLDTDARATFSRRNNSHNSVRSWLTVQQTPPASVPSVLPYNPQTQNRRSRELRTTNPDPEDDYMNIPQNISGVDMYPKKRKGGGHMGVGFVAGLRRVFRRQRHAPSPGSPDRLHTGNTLPPYTSPLRESHVERENLPPSLLPGGTHHHPHPPHRNPNFHVSPPSPEVPRYQPQAVQSVEEERTHSYPDFAMSMPSPQPAPPESTMGDVTAVPIPTVSPRASRTERSILLSQHPTPHSSLHRSSAHTHHTSPPLPTNPIHPRTPTPAANRPPSMLARPPPAPDYLRMSANPSSPALTPSSSFSTELNNPVQNFFSRLYSMPWVAAERITEDYRPGLNRGAWTWKMVKKGKNTIKVLRPVQKPLKSWYAVSSGKGKQTTAEVQLPKWVMREDEALDLLSSGTLSGGTRSTIAPSSPTTRRRSPTHPSKRQRHHHHHNRHRSPRSPSSPTVIPQQPAYPHGYVSGSVHYRDHPHPTSNTPSPPPQSHSTPFPQPVFILNHSPSGESTVLSPLYMQLGFPVNSSPPGLAGRGTYGYMNMPGGPPQPPSTQA